MTQAMLLTPPKGAAPHTEDGEWGVVMLARSGHDKTKQWFAFRNGFYGPTLRVEWEQGSMLTTVVPSVGEALLQRGYARIMTLDEAKEFNARHNTPKPAMKAAKQPKPEPEPEPEPEPHPTVSEKDIPQTPQTPQEPLEEVEDQGPDTLGEPEREPEVERKTTKRRRLADKE